jgi:uncharacterized membrane protein YdjX (TVP38/TMEM64 family)
MTNRKNVLRIVALVFVLALTVVLVIKRDSVKELEALGYPGIFLASLLTNATLILPIPGVLITSAMGAVFNPFWVALASSSGATVGEISGYLAGFSGQAVVENKKWYEKIENWMRKYGDVTILVLALIPNPVFDAAGMTAGVLKMPIHKFLIYCFIGKTLKMLAFAYGGYLIGKQAGG